MLMGLLFAYQLVLLGPYPALKDGAGMNGGLLLFLQFIGLLVGLALLVPAILWAVARASEWLSREELDPSRLRWAGALGLLPFGLASWVAFKLPVFLNNWYYLPRILSDPFGWGWDLFGTASYPGEALLGDLMVYIQVALVLLGVTLGARLMTIRMVKDGLTGRPLVAALTPMLLFLGVQAALLVRLFGG